MLTKLDEKQTRMMHAFRDYYIDYIINNYKYNEFDLSDHKKLVEKFRPDVDWVYQKAGLKPPKFIFIANSYLEEKLMINYIFQFSKVVKNINLNSIIQQVLEEEEEET